MESPRMAVNVVGDVSVAASVKTACALVDCAVYVPRRRKIADGFSLESLCAGCGVRLSFLRGECTREGR